MALSAGRGGAKEEEIGFHAPVFGQLSNTAICLKGACDLMICSSCFYLVESFLPTGPHKEAA